MRGRGNNVVAEVPSDQDLLAVIKMIQQAWSKHLRVAPI